jgi:hypothetical protein
MLQRIQTLYFLGALVLLVICFFIPLAEVVTATGAKGAFTLLGLKYVNITHDIRLLTTILSTLTGLILLISIFGYKNRKNQMKISILAIILLVSIIGVILFQFLQFKKEPGMIILTKIPLIFPLISIILTYLGYKGIKKDEELVRSYDRIR